MKRISAFLSHSSKDIEKVRQIRDILEVLDYEPLLFHLKCLDDDNEDLETFIKREIESRNIFIYCKSKNAEGSRWVQKELEYIKSFDSKRLFTIDISLPFKDTIVQLLLSIAEIIKKNRVFLSCPHSSPSAEFGDSIEQFLIEQNFDVIRYKTLDYSKDDEHKASLTEAGTFISVISWASLESRYCKSELGYVLHNYNINPTGFSNKIIPVYYGVSRQIVEKHEYFNSSLKHFPGIEVEYNPEITEKDKQELLKLL
jgi:hypothetical protein